MKRGKTIILRVAVLSSPTNGRAGFTPSSLFLVLLLSENFMDVIRDADHISQKEAFYNPYKLLAISKNVQYTWKFAPLRAYVSNKMSQGVVHSVLTTTRIS